MSTNINIISGFLGVGKTTFLKKIIPHMNGKIALIENEFGSVGIDGDLIDDKLPIKEISAGCICCSVINDFEKAIEELTLSYKPDHILIEPSGVASLSDITKICKKICDSSQLGIKIRHLITIVDISTFDDYFEEFGNFYLDQIRNAHIIFLSHFDEMDDQEVEKVISKIRSNNQSAFILKEEWYSYGGDKIIEILNTIQDCEIDYKKQPVCMPANRVFSTLSVVNPRFFSEAEIEKMLVALNDKEWGFIIRAKGILELNTNQFIHFNFTPQHYHWEYIEGPREPKATIIGCNLNNERILEWFQK